MYFFLIPIIASLLFIIPNMIDMPLDPEVKAFFYDDPIQLENNLYVAAAGIVAPAGHEDPYKYGLQKFEGEIEDEAPMDLSFVGDVNTICFSQKDFREREDCAFDVEIKGLINQNQVLLERYLALHSNKALIASVGDQIFVPMPGQEIIDLQRLLLARWIGMVDAGKGDAATEEWMMVTRSLHRIFAGKNNLVQSAVWMVVYGFQLDVLPVLLEKDKTLISKYRDSIEALLKPPFTEIWSVKNTWRAEYNLIDFMIYDEGLEAYFFLENDARNDFLEITKENIRIYGLPPDQIREAVDEIQEKHSCHGLLNMAGCMIYNPAWNMVIGGFLKGAELYINAHAFTAEQHALINWIYAIGQDIGVHNMALYLSMSGYKNPFTGDDYEWDDKMQSIVFSKPMKAGEENQPYYLYYSFSE